MIIHAAVVTRQKIVVELRSLPITQSQLGCCLQLHGSPRGIDCHVLVTDSSIEYFSEMKFLLFCSAVLETPKVMSILKLVEFIN